jgi:hypothetical protein
MMDPGHVPPDLVLLIDDDYYSPEVRADLMRVTWYLQDGVLVVSRSAANIDLPLAFEEHGFVVDHTRMFVVPEDQKGYHPRDGFVVNRVNT